MAVGSILEMRLLLCVSGNSAVPAMLWWIPVDRADVWQADIWVSLLSITSAEGAFAFRALCY